MKKSTKKTAKPTKKSPIPKEFKKIIEEALNRYRFLLGMLNYKGDIFYHAEDKEPNENGDKVAMEIHVDHRYLIANLNVFPWIVEDWKNKKMDDDDVERIVAHEVAHIATHTLHWLSICVFKDESETKDAWESLTTVMGRLLYNLDQYKDAPRTR